MNKIFYLGNCGTCARIIDELGLEDKKFTFQDIKTEPITEQQLDEMKKKAGSYEALFSKIARKYKELKLNERKLSEEEMKQFILTEYTFLKRPVIFIKDKLFVGNSKSTVAEAKKEL